jgi:hypothetical protein
MGRPCCPIEPKEKRKINEDYSSYLYGYKREKKRKKIN